MDIEVKRVDTGRERASDPALTALLAMQCFILLVAGPAAATDHWSGRLVLELSVLGFAFLVFVIARGPVATAIAVLAIVAGVARGYSSKARTIPRSASAFVAANGPSLALMNIWP